MPIVFLLSLGGVLLLEPLALRLSMAVGAVDFPDKERKFHTRPTARLGGVVFLTVAFLLMITCVGLSDRVTCSLLFGGLFLLAVGAADDVFSLSAGLKFLLQCAGAWAAVSVLSLSERMVLFGREFSVCAPVAAAIAAGFAVWCVNGANFIDGSDGVCAAVHAWTYAVAAVLFYRGGAYEAAVCAGILCAALLGFFAYNHAPAILFMGDGGSECLGLFTAVFLLSVPISGGNFDTGVWYGRILWLYALPLSDVVFAVVGRSVRGVAPWCPDRTHWHHVLRDKGVSERKTLLILLFSAVLLSLPAFLYP